MVSIQKVLKMSIPTILALSSTTLMGIVDLLFVGELGIYAIGAVGIVNVAILNLGAIVNGVGYEVNSLVARYFGEKNHDKIKNTVYNAVVSSIMYIIPLVIIAMFLSKWLFIMMGASLDVTNQGIGYMRVRLLALCFTLVGRILIGYLRGVGNTKIPMFAALISNVINIVFTYFLVTGVMFFPKMGVLGAGVAFLFGEVIQLFFLIIKVKKQIPVKLNLSHELNLSTIKFINIEGIKIGFQDLGINLTMIFFTVFATRLGDKALASTEIVNNILALAYLPGNGIGISATTLFGQLIGKSKNNGHKGESSQLLKQIILSTLVFIIPISIVYGFNSNWIVSFFSTDKDIIGMTVFVIILSSFFLPFDAFQLVFSGVLRGIGDNTFLLAASLLIGWVFFIPLCYTMTFTLNWGFYGMWISFYTYIFTQMICFTLRVKILMKREFNKNKKYAQLLET